MRKHLAAIALATAALVAPIAVAAPASAAVTFPQCRYEDSNGPCWWDASHRGNGHGISFWVGKDGRAHNMNIPDLSCIYTSATWDGRSTLSLRWSWRAC